MATLWQFMRGAIHGMKVGFEEKAADVRISQYENGARTPKEPFLNALAETLEVSPLAINVPNIDSYVGLMHTLFALEDIYGLKIGEIDGEVCLRLSKIGASYPTMFDMSTAWNAVSKKYKDEQITKEEYDAWRYNYPKFDDSKTWVKVPPDFKFDK